VAMRYLLKEESRHKIKMRTRYHLIKNKSLGFKAGEYTPSKRSKFAVNEDNYSDVTDGFYSDVSIISNEDQALVDNDPEKAVSMD
jgi:hypothetical protein